MTFEELVAFAATQGLRLSNLYELSSGPNGPRWRASFTNGDKFWSQGVGHTAIEAMLAAHHNAIERIGEVAYNFHPMLAQQPTYTPAPTPTATAEEMGI